MKTKSFLFALLGLTLTSCADTPVTPVDTSNSDGGGNPSKVIGNLTGRTPYSMVRDGDEKAHFIGKEGVPFLANSSLMRFDELACCDFLSPEETEPYFALAKETGLSFLDVPFMWSQSEKEEGLFDNSTINTYLNLAKKYGLKLNLIWYGSWVDGDCHGVNIPDYIYANPDKYEVLQDLFDFEPFGYSKIMNWSDPDLLEAESYALWQLMNAVGRWNDANNNYDPVLMVQIGQGIDRFQRWRVEAYAVQGQSGTMSYDEAWAMANDYYTAMGKAVKYASYKAITRAEFCEQSAVTNYVRLAKDTPYMDLVCPTYLHTISSAKSGMRDFSEEYPDMPVVNAENFGDDASDRSMLVQIASGGVGFTSFSLSPARYYPLIPNGTLYGRYNPEGGETLAEQFPEVNGRASKNKAALRALSMVDAAAASATRKEFALLGFDNLVSDEQKIYFENGILLHYSNPAETFGYAIKKGNYLYCYSDKAASITLNNCVVTAASVGMQSEGEWIQADEVVNVVDNKTVNLEAGLCYRLRITNIGEPLSRSELSQQGYKSISDSIRG